MLVTNFHLPRSSLLLLVEAFCGPRVAPAVRHGPGRGVPVPLLRRRHGGGSRHRAGPVGMSAGPRSRSPPRDGAARTGVGAHRRGARTRSPPSCRSGTRGAVKALDSADLEALGAEVVLANTYHLMLRPGADVVAALGGLHRFTGWAGHTLTDSGGYQVHSLRPAVDDDGVTFASVYDGDRLRLTPESAVEAQGLIGADIQMVLDVCATLPAPAEVAAAGGRPDRGVGRPGPQPPSAARGQTRGPGPVRHRPGRHRSGAAGGERPADRRRSTSTATGSAACRWASPARPCSRPWRPPCPICPPTGPAT